MLLLEVLDLSAAAQADEPQRPGAPFKVCRLNEFPMVDEGTDLFHGAEPYSVLYRLPH